MMKLRKLARVVFLVRDFPASLAFYSRLLGEPRVLRGEAWAEFALDNAASLCLHSGWPEMPYDREDFGRSPDELLFLVEDIEAARVWLTKLGIALSETHEPGPGLKVAELADPDGRRIALEERA